MKHILLLVFLILSAAMTAEEEFYFRFRISDPKEINMITKAVSIDNFIDGMVYAYASESELNVFSLNGYSIEMLPHPGTLYQPIMTDDRSIGRSWQYYPTYDAFVDIMYQFQTEFPDLCTITSIGNTTLGREILIAKISDNVLIKEAEPEFFYSSSIHGDETTGYILLLNLIQYLLQNYGVLPEITNLVDNMEIWICPLHNPDGTYYGGNHTVFGARRANANNVDLNRNFPDPLAGDHPDGNDWQPETVVMMDFAENNNIVMGANFHGGAEVVNYPWDTWPQLHADNEWYIHTSQIYANSAQANSPAGYMSGFNNGITNGYAWYSIQGGRQDYMNYFQNAREVTIEVSDVKLLPESQLDDLWNYNRAALLLYLEQNLYGIHGLISDTEGNPIAAKIEIIDHDIDNSEVYSHPVHGDFYRLLSAGTYDLQVSAYGYQTAILQNIAVQENTTTYVEIILTQSPSYAVSGTVKNGVSLQPLSATLEFVNTPLEPVSTDENGFYQIDEVFAGSYLVYVSAEEVSNLLTEVIVSEDNTIHDFLLYPGETEDFESGDFSSFPWSFAGNASWIISTDPVFEGSYAAVSGDIGNNAYSELILELDVTAAGEIGFYYKVSSESGYDFLKFYLNGEMIQSWSGEVDWQYFHQSVDAGNNVFKWRYQKDNSVSHGSDCGWIDLVSFPYTEEVTSVLNSLIPQMQLHGNYPNPFYPSRSGRSSSTIISFEINTQDHVILEVFNIKGQKIKTLLNRTIAAGNHEVFWNGTDDQNKSVATGLYFYRLSNADYIFVDKMMLLK
jgi:hypothetical protein